MNIMTPKQRARVRIMQVLYQQDISNQSIENIKVQFLANKKDKFAKTFFNNTLDGIDSHLGELKQMLDSVLKENSKDIAYVERAILYLATYELCYCPHLSHKIIINEAVELTKSYGGKDSYKFINYTLDRIKEKRTTLLAHQTIFES